MSYGNCPTPGDPARVPPQSGDTLYVAVPREVFGGLLLTLQQIVRRLESHCRNPGVVDQAVMASARREIIQGAALLRMADHATAEAIDTEISLTSDALDTLRVVKMTLDDLLLNDELAGSPEPHVAFALRMLLPHVDNVLARVPNGEKP